MVEVRAKSWFSANRVTAYPRFRRMDRGGISESRAGNPTYFGFPSYNF